MKSKPLSLHPLTFDEAVSALLETKPQDRLTKKSVAMRKSTVRVLKNKADKPKLFKEKH